MVSFITPLSNCFPMPYDNIEKGVYDVSNEAHGIKVGVTATNSARYMQKDGNGSGGKGGCC